MGVRYKRRKKFCESFAQLLAVLKGVYYREEKVFYTYNENIRLVEAVDVSSKYKAFLYDRIY